jgi:hypothetical protein
LTFGRLVESTYKDLPEKARRKEGREGRKGREAC